MAVPFSRGHNWWLSPFVLAAAVWYLDYVFGLRENAFWSAGIGDWMDPYFINALLEHWYRAAISLTDPASPPMYYPARQTLGYSHGLVLFALFYVPIRVFTHPFIAYNLTLVLVVATGSLCLYALLRRLGLTFAESFLLAALFCSSQNVINGSTGTWSQRASVFLIPPILWLLAASWRAARGVDAPRGNLRRRRGAPLVIAWLAGLLAALMFTQDFYTAQFGLLFVLLAGVPVAVEHRRSVMHWMRDLWRRQSRRSARAALLVAAAAIAWTCVLVLTGGVDIHLLGLRLRSHDWLRPTLLAIVALMVFVARRSGPLAIRPPGLEPRWLIAVASGGVVGMSLFLSIYIDAYRERRTFPEEHLLNALVQRDPGEWTSLLDAARDLVAYDTLRVFVLVFATALLAWLPWSNTGRKARLHLLWFAAVSLMVLIVPLRLGGFSLWTAFFGPLPGFSVIRDPRRIIYLYELAAVLTVGAFLTTLPRKSWLRVTVATMTALLLVGTWNRETFSASRPIATYDRWVARPIAIDPDCKSFFMSRASDEYTSRSEHMWTLVSIDALFISLNHAMPTLNGYSAWFPDGWDLFNPQEADYDARVERWIARHGLTNVCALNIDARTMTPKTSGVLDR